MPGATPLGACLLSSGGGFWSAVDITEVVPQILLRMTCDGASWVRAGEKSGIAGLDVFWDTSRNVLLPTALLWELL
jgi:hypothetical protein